MPWNIVWKSLGDYQDCEVFWSWTKSILYDEMAVSLWNQAQNGTVNSWSVSQTRVWTLNSQMVVMFGDGTFETRAVEMVTKGESLRTVAQLCSQAKVWLLLTHQYMKIQNTHVPPQRSSWCGHCCDRLVVPITMDQNASFSFKWPLADILSEKWGK